MLPRLPELPDRSRSGYTGRQREPALTRKPAFFTKAPGESSPPKNARAETFYPEREFTFEDLGLNNLHATRAIDEVKPLLCRLHMHFLFICYQSNYLSLHGKALFPRVGFCIADY